MCPSVTLIVSEPGSGWAVIQDIDERLEKRLGRLHARLRLGIEADHEAQIFGQGINYFHIENLPLSHVAIRLCLKLAGICGRRQRSAARIIVDRFRACLEQLADCVHRMAAPYSVSLRPRTT